MKSKLPEEPREVFLIESNEAAISFFLSSFLERCDVRNE